VIRPGPQSITPGICPGGVVIHVYAVPSQVLLLSQRIGPRDDVYAAAERAAAVDAAAVCLVAYDGDTGERYSADDWTAFQ
jgi:hypothetical protein